MFMFLVILVITLLIVKYTIKCFYFKRRGLDSPMPMPFFGLSFDNYSISPLKINLHRRNKFGKVYGLWFGHIPVIVVSDPEIVKQVTQTQAHNFTSTTVEEVDIKYFKDSFLMKKGKEWKDGRALVSPVFTTKRIKDIFPQIKKATNPLFENIENLIKEGKQDDIEIKGLLKGYSLDVVAKFCFALELNSAKDKDHPFVKAVRKFTEFGDDWKIIFLSILPEKITKALKIEFFDTNAMEYVANLIRHLIKERNENTDKKYNDFLDMLLDSIRQKNLNVKDEEIIGVVVIFFFAGLETVSSTISNILYCLAHNPEHQAKLYDELISLFPNKDLEYDDLNKSGYLEAVIKESQRLFPTLTLLFRVAEQPIEIKGLKIKKNEAIAIDTMSLHNSPEYWSEPEKFNPERFSNSKFDFDNVVDSDSMLFLPFGSGIRSCIATRYALTQVKYAVAKFVLNYEILRTEKTASLKYIPIPNQLMYKSMYLLFEKRDN